MFRCLALRGTVLGVMYLFAVRPWHLRWGTMDDEVFRPLPGDDVVLNPMVEATRAATIHAPPEAVWPWLVQMGYKRAGFYSYDRLDNAGIPSANEILPEFQNLKPGDRIPMGPHVGIEVITLDPGRTLVLAGHDVPIQLGIRADVSVAFVLEQLAGKRTRLIERVRGQWQPGFPAWLYAYLVFEPGDFVMMRKQLLGIKQRAERAAGSHEWHFPLPYPARIGRLLFKAPIPLYRRGLGHWLRFDGMGILLLTTTGRKTGLPRATPLEYRLHDGTYYVISAWGSRSDWYRNLLANPEVHVQVGDQSFDAVAEPLEDVNAKIEVAELFYGGPDFLGMRALLGLPPQPTEDQIRTAVAEVRVVALQTRREA